MTIAFALHDVTKRFGRATALASVTVEVPASRIIGVIGKNGCGKTTLIHHVIGLQLPTHGACVTLGTPTAALGPDELSRIGVVHQHDRFLGWMRVEQHIEYVASFYASWDRVLEHRLLDVLELDPQARVGTLSPGTTQKLAIVLAVCHHPSLLLLDEPLSDLDPIAREAMLDVLLERFRADNGTIVISSHILRDIERIVDTVICLDRGRVIAHEPLDALQERFAEWVVGPTEGRLPSRFDDAFIVEQEGDGRQARLVVRDPAAHRDRFRGRYRVEVTERAMNLERVFPLLLAASGPPPASAPNEGQLSGQEQP